MSDTPQQPEAQTITAEKLCALTGLTDRRHRQISKDGWFPPPIKSQYPLVSTLQGLFKYYRDQRTDASTVKLQKLHEEIREKQTKNLAREGKLVDKDGVAADLTRYMSGQKAILRQRLENEFPAQVAGMDAAQVRVEGKKIVDEICRDHLVFLNKWKTK